MAQDNLDLNPNGSLGGLQGTSSLYKVGTSPNTRSVVTQKVRVLAPAYGGEAKLFQIGVLSNFSPTENRTVEPVRGIGMGDVIAELVPGNTEPMTASIERTMLYLSNLWQSTGYAGGVSGPVRSLRHHRWPFDVQQEIVFSRIADNEVDAGSGFLGGNKTTDYSWQAVDKDPEGRQDGGLVHNCLVTYYEACWWQDWNTAFQRDTAMVMENGTIMITDVHDGSTVYGEFLATGNDPTIGQLGSQRYAGLGGIF